MNQKKCKSLRRACRLAATNFTVPVQQYGRTSGLGFGTHGMVQFPLTMRWAENTYRRIYQDTKRSIRA